MAHIFPLQPEDALEVVELARGLYPAEFALTREQVFRNLDVACKARCCLSYGLGESGALIGYLMAWVENTRLEGLREPVVLVDDVCIVPEARQSLYSLFSALRQGIDEGGWSRLPIESAARVKVEALYLEHPRVLERLGFRLTQRARYFSHTLGEELTWMRYSPIAQLDALTDRDGLDLSAELLDG